MRGPGRLSGDSGAMAGGVEPSHGSFNDSTDNLKDQDQDQDQDSCRV